MRRAFALLMLAVACTRVSGALQLPQALAGQAAGVSHGALIVAGGSSFNLPPWKGGVKQWSAAIYVFKTVENKPLKFSLDHAFAYGCSAVWNDRLIIAGGSDGKQNYSQVYSLEWSASAVRTGKLAELPTKLSHCSATIAGDNLYVFGGQTATNSREASATLYRLALNKSEAGWHTCVRFPALGRILPVLTSVNETIYLFSGAALTPERKYLNDSWKYNEQSGWRRMADCTRAHRRSASVCISWQDPDLWRRQWRTCIASRSIAGPASRLQQNRSRIRHRGEHLDGCRHAALWLGHHSCLLVGRCSLPAGRRRSARSPLGRIRSMATQAIERNRTGSKWLVLTLLWGVAVLNYLDRQVIFSQFPLIQHDLKLASYQLGLISSVFLAVYGLLSPFAGYVADRWGRARTIVFSLAVWSGATWMTAHVQSLNTMLFSRVLMGVSEAFYLPAALALIASMHGPATRSLATGLHQSGLYTGIILGGAWGGWMGEHHGWRPTFTILGIAGLIYGVVLFFFLSRDRAQTDSNNPMHALKQVASSSGFGNLATAFGAVSVANWLIYTWLPIFLIEHFGFSMAQAGFTAAFYVQFPGYVGMLLSGVLSDRLALQNPRARISIQIASMVLTAPLLLTLSFTTSRGLLIIILIGIGLLRPCFDVNAMPVLRQIVPGNLAATGYGLLNLVGCLAGGFSATLAGSIKDNFGLAAAYPFSAAILIAGALSLFFLKNKGTEPVQS